MILTAEATTMLGRKITLTYTHETGEIRLRDDKSTLHLSGIIGFTGEGSEKDADYVRRKVTGSKTANQLAANLNKISLYFWKSVSAAMIEDTVAR